MRETLEAKVSNGCITLTLPEKSMNSKIIEIQERSKEIVERMEKSPESLDSYVKQNYNNDNDVNNNEIVGGLYTWIKNTKFGKLIKYLHTEAPFPIRALTGVTEAVTSGAILAGCGGVIPEPPGPVQKIEIPAGFDKDYFEEICFTWEYGSSEIHNTYRWVDTPKFFLINPTEEQKNITENKMSELAKFTDYVVVPKIVNNINSANVTVEWCDLDEIPYGNVGYFTFSHKNGVIYEGEILLYKNLDDILTKRAILAEGGGILGVTNDSYEYPNSIFYQGPSQGTKFTIEDLAVGDVLYQLDPNTSKKDFNELYLNSL